MIMERSAPASSRAEVAVHDAAMRSRRPSLYWLLMTLSMLANLVGGGAATLLGRYYFVQGGSDRWVYTWLQTTGFPLLLIPLLAKAGLRWRRRRAGVAREHQLRYDGSVQLSAMKTDAEAAGDVDNVDVGKEAQPENHSTGNNTSKNRCSRKRLWKWSVVIGLLLGLDNLLFAWGLSYLPVSTNNLLWATTLAFTAVFSYFLNGRRPTPYSVNSVVLIGTSAVLLGLQSSSDKPPGTNSLQYGLGFGATLAGSALCGLLLPIMELAYARLGLSDFVFFVHVQLGSSVAASVFSLVGMSASGSFRALLVEHRTFGAGPAGYVSNLVWNAVCWQLFACGTYGMIVLGSSLLCCAFIAATLPVVPILAVFFFHDSFTAIKGIAAFMGVWGFLSYIYEGYQGRHAHNDDNPVAES